MKNTKTKFFSAITIATMIIFLCSASKNQQSNSKYLTMQAIESALNGGAKIVIAFPDGQTQEFDLSKQGSSENASKINKVINALSEKGYELISSNGLQVTATYIFVKK